ncbi:OmpH family outer membrane protein [Lacinutrix chionoecetis]
MKKIILLVAATISLLSCNEQKIGYIDNGKVINEIQEKKDIEAKFKVREDAFNAKADSLEKSIQMEAQEFQVKAQRMSTANQEKAYQELVQKKQLQDQRLQFEKQQLAQSFRTEIDSVIVKVKNHVKDYGKNNGYTYILGTSDAAASVIYGKEEQDLSETVIKALDEAYKK